MIDHKITVQQEKIADFSRRNHIRKLSLFGSVLGVDFGPDSDVDVLVHKKRDCIFCNPLLCRVANER
jgi:predicted nucleotidyltransferase